MYRPHGNLFRQEHWVEPPCYGKLACDWWTGMRVWLGGGGRTFGRTNRVFLFPLCPACHAGLLVSRCFSWRSGTCLSPRFFACYHVFVHLTKHSLCFDGVLQFHSGMCCDPLFSFFGVFFMVMHVC